MPKVLPYTKIKQDPSNIRKNVASMLTYKLYYIIKCADDI